MMTEAELAEIEKRVNAATMSGDGWLFARNEMGNGVVLAKNGAPITRVGCSYVDGVPEAFLAMFDTDVELLVKAPTDIRALLAEVRSVSERADGMEREAKTARNTALVNLAGFKNEKARADAATSRVIALEGALTPFARLQVPKKTVGNAGAYSLYFADIQRAKDILANSAVPVDEPRVTHIVDENGNTGWIFP